MDILKAVFQPQWLKATTFIALAALAAIPASADTPTLSPQENQIRHELVTIPFLTVFDDLSFTVDRGTVTLTGQVRLPVVKDYAENAVKHVPGVTRVVDQIEVLPVSTFDDRIRLQTLRKLERTASLYRYFMGATPSIRIIVKNGNVTLDGSVLNAMDKQLAFMAVNQIPGVFQVTNNLRTDN